MARRKYSVDERTIARRLKEGRGSGFGKDYKPWIYVHDIPSKGLSTRVQGWKTERLHHFLSNLELQYFYILEFSSIVTDSREQYPLERSKTRSIAERLKYKHPTDPSTQTHIVMTTDFLVTIKQSGKFVEQARTIKHSNDLSSERTLEKLEIERIYWLEENIDWGIVTEKDIDPIIADNVSWLYEYKDLSALNPLTNKDVSRIHKFLVPNISNGQTPLRDLTNACDGKLGYSNSMGSSLSVVRYLIANKLLKVDMKKPINPSEPLAILDIAPNKH